METEDGGHQIRVMAFVQGGVIGDGYGGEAAESEVLVLHGVAPLLRFLKFDMSTKRYLYRKKSPRNLGLSLKGSGLGGRMESASYGMELRWGGRDQHMMPIRLRQKLKVWFGGSWGHFLPLG